jgi:hypothetical protein
MADLIGAVTREVEALPPSIRDSGLAASVIVLAERLDAASPRDAAPIGREIRETLAKLHLLATEIPSEEVDPLEQLLGGKPHLRVAGS